MKSTDANIKGVELFPELYKLRVHHQFYYSTTEPVPIDDVITSLQGLKVILQTSPGLIEGLLPGINISGIDIYVDEIRNGSLWDILTTDITFGGKEHYDRFRSIVQKWSESKYNADPNDPEQQEKYEKEVMMRFLTFLGASVLATGVLYAVTMSTASEGDVQKIDVHHNTIINFGAGEFDLDSDHIKAVIKAATQDKQKQIAGAAIKALKPAKQDDTATLEISGVDEVTFDQEIIRTVPSTYTAPMPTEQSTEYQDVEVVIYASDQDAKRKNWAGIVPGVIDKRVKFTLADDLAPAKIHGHTKFKADLSVIKRFNKADNMYVIDHVLLKNTNL